jgi:hypothetical protein
VASQSSISVSTDRSQYLVSTPILISGKVLDAQDVPVEGAGVSIQVNDPQDTPIRVTLVYSDRFGMYSDQFALSPEASIGEYTVFAAASKAGLSNSQAETQFTVISQTFTSTSSSSSTLLQPQPNPNTCLIATATYGSAMAPEVVRLRNFRDSQVARTIAGRHFMLAFNAFYYSFSPQAASLISAHSNLAAFMRVGMYPMISILSVASKLDSILPIDAEAAVTVSGILAASSLGFVYFGIPLTMLGFGECERSRRMTRWTVISCAISLSILTVAETVAASTLLLIGSTTVVLSFLSLGSVSLPYFAQRSKYNIYRRGFSFFPFINASSDTELMA